MRWWMVVAAMALAACGSSAGTDDGAANDVQEAWTGDVTDAHDVTDAADGTPDVPLVAPVPADCRPNAAPFPERPTPTEPPTLPRLHVEGTEVVDLQGNRVALRGVNLGGWLVIESWMAGLGTLSQVELLAAMETEAAAEGLGGLYRDAVQSNYIPCQLLLKPQWVCVQERKAYMQAHAGEQADAVAAFWTWFDGQPWVYEERSFWRWLEKRFGYAGMLELQRTWRDHFVTELDLERIAALGLNLVRVPVWYQALETDQEGENGFVADGWRRLDDLFTWARRHGIYVMLDMHGAPGGQSTWWHTGLENAGTFFTTPACQDKATRLWGAIAHYLADEPHLAGFDLLNEPNGSPNKKTYCDVHQRLYDAVRAEAPQAIVVLEDGFLPVDKICGPAELGWTNAMMQFHDYPGGATADELIANVEGKELEQIRKMGDRLGAPVFYGEFNVYPPTDFEQLDDPADRWQIDAMDRLLTLFGARGIHWTPWSWKHFATPSLWGVYHPENAGARVDLKDATFDELKAAFEAMDSATWVEDADYAAVLRARAADPAQALNLSSAAE